MKIILQRVNSCTLTSGDYVSYIDFGLLAFVGVSNFDTIYDVKYLAKKMANLRIFKDENDKTNLSIKDVNGQMMIVSNFTLQANASRGTRPDFSRAAGSEKALELYEKLIDEVRLNGVEKVEKGNFGNHMHLDSKLDGPFTIILESEGRNNE